MLCLKIHLVGWCIMSKDWSRYNEELVKRGEILIDPISFGLKAEEKTLRK